MRKAAPTRADYAQAIVDRDEAIADRDFLLSVFHDLGASGDITALAMQLAAVRAMVSNATMRAGRRVRRP